MWLQNVQLEGLMQKKGVCSRVLMYLANVKLASTASRGQPRITPRAHVLIYFDFQFEG